jgi:hypothetical protein
MNLGFIPTPRHLILLPRGEGSQLDAVYQSFFICVGKITLLSQLKTLGQSNVLKVSTFLQYAADFSSIFLISKYLAYFQNAFYLSKF